MKRILRIGIIAFSLLFIDGVLLQIPSQAQEGPLTVAESSGFTATSRHVDVLEFIAELQSISPLLRVEELCRTAEGKMVPLIIIGNPLPSSPADLHFDDRAVVYFQANIHAGEVEGKEAALMLARDLVLGKTRDYFDRLVILIVPNFNPDGNDKISTSNRRNQDGPEQGVGIRYNGQNLDLNRDGLKLESHEALGLVQNVLNRWDPIFFLDSHTHNGSYHQEPVTWTWGLNPNGDTALLEFTADVMMPAINRHMMDEYNTMCTLHGDFLDPSDPGRGWVPLGPQPRYLSNYVGLRNRLSILNENYPYAPYETRVRGCYHLYLTFLDYLYDNRDEVVSLLRDADRRTIERGLEPSGDDVFIISYGREAIPERLTIQGYEMEVVETAGGRRRTRPTEVKRTYTDVPYFGLYTPERTIPFPRGYLITARDMTVVGKLLQHGITVERLTAPATLEVESFTVTGMQAATRLNQGHYTNTVEGEYATGEVAFPAGTFYVSTAQPLANVTAYLLEPESDDGLLFWNFFDKYLASQWGGGPQTYPVHRLLQSTSLVKETIREIPDR